MKALSLTQPWATAMALGIKEWETRSWPTSFRGYVAIHAAKGFPGYCKEFAEQEHVKTNGRIPLPREMPLGRIVAVGEIVECRRTDELRAELSALEQSWGDYSDGRFAFKFNLQRMVIPPIYARGPLGFWSVDWDLWKDIRDSLCTEGAHSDADQEKTSK